MPISTTSIITTTTSPAVLHFVSGQTDWLEPGHSNLTNAMIVTAPTLVVSGGASRGDGGGTGAGDVCCCCVVMLPFLCMQHQLCHS